MRGFNGNQEFIDQTFCADSSFTKNSRPITSATAATVPNKYPYEQNVNGGFSAIPQFLERVLLEHIVWFCRLESQLLFSSIRSVRILSRTRDIIEKIKTYNNFQLLIYLNF